MLLVLETCRLVGPVAKWLVRGVPATAKRDRGSPAKPEWLAFHVDEFDFTLDT